MGQIQAIQEILGVAADGAWGPLSQAALDALLHPQPAKPGVHRVRASSFADPADIAAFKRCKARGGSDQECFAVGDNGVGAWGDLTDGPRPMCALPPEDMIDRWGSMATAARKLVRVTANGRTVVCVLADTMPHRANIRNGMGIDLSPAACAELGLRPPVSIAAEWEWA